jgi:hypothetical protein
MAYTPTPEHNGLQLAVYETSWGVSEHILYKSKRNTGSLILGVCILLRV